MLASAGGGGSLASGAGVVLVGGGWTELATGGAGGGVALDSRVGLVRVVVLEALSASIGAFWLHPTRRVKAARAASEVFDFIGPFGFLVSVPGPPEN